MTNTPTHYFNFKPCEAVQWSGTVEGFDVMAEHFADYGFDIAQAGDMCQIWASDMSTGIYRLRPGQWLVKQGDKVFVLDEEPAWVVGWVTRDERKFAWTKLKRPALSNGFLGPWEVVE